MAHVKFSKEVEAILRASTITGNVLILPPGQLERSLYEQVNKVLVNCGGKWKRGKGHIFDGHPMTKLGLALETGVANDTKKEFQQFYTPGDLARRMVRMACDGALTIKSALEPSAGRGAIAEALALSCQDGLKLQCVELDEDNADHLARRGFETIQGDFLATEFDDKFDAVVMNPPFTKKQDLKHLAHAFRYLKPEGRIVTILQGNRTLEEIEQAVGEKCYLDIDVLPPGTFNESGTPIQTLLVTVDKWRVGQVL